MVLFCSFSYKLFIEKQFLTKGGKEMQPFKFAEYHNIAIYFHPKHNVYFVPGYQSETLEDVKDFLDFMNDEF